MATSAGHAFRQEVSDFLKVHPSATAKLLVFLADDRPVAALIRGDHEANEAKIRRAFGAAALTPAAAPEIERATGARADFFAYPYGLWDYRVRSRVRLAGYRAGLTLNPGLNRAFADPCSLRRLNVPAGISTAAFETWAAGLTSSHS